MLIRIRRGTAAQWSAGNPVLALAEPGWDTTNGALKIGDGVTAWNSLGVANAAAVTTAIAAAIAAQFGAWTNFGSLNANAALGTPAAQFRTAIGGMIQLSGQLTISGAITAGTVIAVLPVASPAPASLTGKFLGAGSAAATWAIDSLGQLTCTAALAATDTINFDGEGYRAA